ncbi:NAD-dependent epimerase [Geothermobacter hydrogeniphilus]|uniref:UDP-glucose 4-epimerase n=1 Tax=Geothermobacter hydrogeniphilus TaxID=1969733 RepID=A0A2K2HAK6_9BACT|nr:NAD-dependent epimerase/dehydratase family protein [Geothermobacter hydrogeniphilus]PNU20297.1 NAD-dependent epimerase [Geothermobacter hydrogeniphilus]
MKVLVLGGNGFIGSHIVDQLLADGHSVCVYDRSPERFRDPLPGVDYRLAEFDDLASLAESLEGVDIVCHSLGTTVPSTSNKEPVFDIKSNLISTVRLLKLIVDSGVKKLIYLSSGGTVYGVPEMIPVIEEHPLCPICSYGVVKVSIEKYIHMFHHLYGLDYVILRASNPYGERQGHSGVQGVISTFVNKVARKVPVDIWGDGTIVRDYIYIGDLAKLCVSASFSNITGTFNAGSGIGYSVLDIVNVISEVADGKVEINYHQGRNFDVPKIVLDINKARKMFLWSPSVSLRDGIGRVLEWETSINMSLISGRLSGEK